MFPFRYAHVYIPLLPAGLAEVLATPTPFLIGLDVIIADLDVGSLHIPPSVNIPRPEGKLLSSLQEALALVLQPELRSADSAFAPPPPNTSLPHMQDKEIRAVFMRTLAKLLQGYRHCLTIIRIHPSPVLTFHKAGFLGARGLSQCPFSVRLLDSMFFNGLVAERGAPWRPTDIFDDLVFNLPEQLRLESINPELELQHIQECSSNVFCVPPRVLLPASISRPCPRYLRPAYTSSSTSRSPETTLKSFRRFVPLPRASFLRGCCARA
ncbi:unnamed protein product [Leptidea sinapis]|uniref:UDENN domain-containing protein n=1 Tax=Leptidea sinapis TaxID=189913 RepID=A0A5E4Q9P9_9NEOP|nr:unnamed protein product [Leptidea sinapis]